MSSNGRITLSFCAYGVPNALQPGSPRTGLRPGGGEPLHTEPEPGEEAERMALISGDEDVTGSCHPDGSEDRKSTAAAKRGSAARIKKTGVPVPIRSRSELGELGKAAPNGSKSPVGTAEKRKPATSRRKPVRA